MANRNQKKVVFFINVDWYFNLHWLTGLEKHWKMGIKSMLLQIL